RHGAASEQFGLSIPPAETKARCAAACPRPDVRRARAATAMSRHDFASMELWKTRKHIIDMKTSQGWTGTSPASFDVAGGRSNYFTLTTARSQPPRTGQGVTT